MPMKRKKITCEKARKIPIISILTQIGYFSQKVNGKEAWYQSPFRLESQASFKVCLLRNSWFDHGGGFGGNVIDLVVNLKKCDVSEALQFLTDLSNYADNNFSFHQKPKIDYIAEKNYNIIKVISLEHKALIDYLLSRKIDIRIAKKHCKEIHYKLNSKRYFAIAFKNDKNGFEIRNKYIKGNLVAKEITSIKKESNQVCVFEGFIDFLSFRTLYKEKSFSMDYVILNSVSNSKNILSKIKNYKKIFCFLDNDTSGRNATKFLLKNLKNSIDFSFKYRGYNDFNEYLIGMQ